MTREPNWPTVDEVWAAAKRNDSSIAEGAIAMCRQAWLAANDDPSTELPGAVRISPGGVAYVRLPGRGNMPWAAVSYGPRGPEYRPQWLYNADVAGWTRGTPVEGTPAAKAAEQ